MHGTPLNTLLAEKKYDQIEAAWKEALLDPLIEGPFLLDAAKGLGRVGQKTKLQALAGITETALRAQSDDPDIAMLRWSLLKEAVRAGATPSTTDGFHKLFEDALTAAYKDHPSLNALLGRFKFREAKDPLDGLARIERVEKWLPFEVGRCFVMAGRGAGKVLETNFALDSVRLDFERAKGIAVPIGVANKNLVPLPDDHFLRDKLLNPGPLAQAIIADPPGGLKRLLDSFDRTLTMTEVKEAVASLVPDTSWSSWWTAAKKHPQVVTHGTGKNTTVEWSHSVGAADDALLVKFEKASVKDKVDIFKKNAKRSVELETTFAAALASEAGKLVDREPHRAFEIGVLVEKSPGVKLPFLLESLVPETPAPLLAQLSDRVLRERLLELHSQKYGSATLGPLAAWFFKEEDVRTVEWIDRKLQALDPETRERTLDRVVKSPRSGPRAFVWYCQKATNDEAMRARLNPNALSRLLDAISWEELGATRTKVREMFDRSGLAAIWMMKQATVDEVRVFLDALTRHHELEPHRRDALLAAAEMRFPTLRKIVDDVVFVTPEALESKRKELEQILKVDIPENTKGIALAAAEGDLSENFEYKARRDKQQLLSARAGKLQEDLSKARALDPATIDTTEVRPGSKVTLGLGKSVTLLGPWDSKPEQGIYSYLSDLGKALLGKTVGEFVVVLGEETTVEKIEPWR